MICVVLTLVHPVRRHQQFNALQMIALDLTSECDPALLSKCAAFFIENGQFDKAVDMFAISKKVGRPSAVHGHASASLCYFHR